MSPRWDEDGPTPVRSPYPIGATATYSVDPERLGELVDRLHGVISQVAAVERKVEVIAGVREAAADVVSRNIALQSAIMMERSRRFLADWRRQLILTVDALEVQAAAYRGADAAATA